MWLLIPSMDLDSAPADSALSLGLKSPSPVIGQSVWWNGKSRSAAELRRAFVKDRSLSLLSGMTLEPSTVNRGVESFLSSLRVSLANRSQLQENGKALATKDGSGRKSRGSSAKSSRKSSSSKTSLDCSSTPIATLTDGKWMGSQMTLLEVWEPFSGTWPGSGSMRNGVVYERPMSAPVTAGKESSFWPTAKSITGGPNSQRDSRPQTGGADLQEFAEQWKTPNTRDHHAQGPRLDHPQRQLTLCDQTDHWATPNVPNGGRVLSEANVIARGSTEKGKRQVGLEMESLYWQTPQARDHRSGETISEYGNARPLNEQVVNWATLDAGMRGGHNRSLSENAADRPLLKTQTENWATPRAEDPESCGNHPGASDSLTGQSSLWKTPHGLGNIDSMGKAGGSGGGEFALQMNNWEPPMWATPISSTEGSSGGLITGDGRKKSDLAVQSRDWETSPQVPSTSDGRMCFCGVPGCALPGHKRKLNPLFVLWLMSWPIFWLTTEPVPYGRSEMELYRLRQRGHLLHLLGGQG
jgi:hypothetical protein